MKLFALSSFSFCYPGDTVGFTVTNHSESGIPCYMPMYGDIHALSPCLSVSPILLIMIPLSSLLCHVFFKELNTLP